MNDNNPRYIEYNYFNSVDEKNKVSIVSIFIFFLSLFYSSSTLSQSDSILYSFFVAGHTYGQPGVNNVGFHPPFKQKFDYIQSREEIEFGVLTGDIVSPNPVAQDWDEIDADIELLGLPVYFAVGNHDMENRPLFESRYGSTYYSFNYQNDLFIILDPNIDAWSITGEQLAFLQETISSNATTADNIYVFFHQILWRTSDNEFSYIQWNSSAGRGDTLNFWTEIIPIFHNLPNPIIMFAGDLGASWSTDVTYDHFDNITLISTGMGDPSGENFIVTNIHEDKSVTYDLICLSNPSLNCLGELTDYLEVTEVELPSNIDGNSNENTTSKTMVYPIPATNSIIIEHHSKKAINVQLKNLQGKIVVEKNYTKEDNNISLDVSTLPKGFYFLRIYDDSGTQKTFKIVVD